MTTPNTLEFERTLLATMMLRPNDCWRCAMQRASDPGAQDGHEQSLLRALQPRSKRVHRLAVGDAFEAAGRKALGKLAVAMASEAVLPAVRDAYSQRIVAGLRQRQART